MSIVLTGAMVLAAVSTVVAFKGWPGANADQTSTPAAMLADSGAVISAEPVADRAAIVVPEAARARPAGSGRTRRSSTSGSAPATSVTTGTTGGSAVGRGVGSGSGGQANGSGSASGKPTARAPKLGDGVRDTGTTLGGGATQAVGDVGDAVAPVSPQLDQTVDAVGKVVGDTVQGVTNTVADVVYGLLPPR